MESNSPDDSGLEPAGWYHAEGDPPDTVRYWNGSEWVGGPVAGPTDAAPHAYLSDSSLASAGERVGARAIDWVILAIIMTVLIVVGGGDGLQEWASAVMAAAEAGLDPPEPDFTISPVFALLASALPFTWDAAWVALLGGTPGKLMLGARVANAKAPTWQRATALQAVLRASHRLLFLVGYISPILGDLGFLAILGIFIASMIMVFTDPTHRTVMDRVGGTVVARADALGQPRTAA